MSMVTSFAGSFAQILPDVLAGRFYRLASNGSCTGHLYIAGAGPVGFSDRKTGKSQPLNILQKISLSSLSDHQKVTKMLPGNKKVRT